MSKRLITIFFLITIFLILFHGIHRIYEIFYSSYFSYTDYTQIAFIGKEKAPTKTEILFYGFKDIKVIVISSVISILVICSTKVVRNKI